ncbi:MAG: LacI family DNA-binding transcriptional regulator [Micropruina sp.]
MSLARQVGVSRQTVSNVINNPEVVKPGTREKVLAAIRASGYRPSAIGRALRTRRSMNLGHRLFPVADGINGAIMDRFLHSLSEEAQGRGFRVNLLTVEDDLHEVETLTDLHQGLSIDGAVLTHTYAGDPRPDRLEASGVPTVAWGRPWGKEDTGTWVDVDGGAGTEEATLHLRSLGHTRIGFLGWQRPNNVGEDRCNGWLRGVAGLGCEDLLIESTDGLYEGAQGAKELLARGATALVCASDSLGLGALTAYRQQAIPTGPSIPVIGFDDTPVARAAGMSSVAQPVEACSRQLVSMITTQLQGMPLENSHVILKPTLVLRNLQSFAR